MMRRPFFWLCVLFISLLAMIMLGGATRLTGSGLSIVQWKPLTGILPPLNQADWEHLFQLYKTSPEFQKIHPSMDLDGFRSIFWLEYIHRLQGRLLGLWLLIPTFMIFRSHRYRAMRQSMVVLWIGGLLQGVLGWYMVKSGLIHDPFVSPYRLSMHLVLGMALLTMCANLVIAAHEADGHVLSKPQGSLLQRSTLWALGGLITLTVIWGGFVAGLKAGYIYNTFPKMGGTWLPSDFWVRGLWWENVASNPAAVQFIHRILAMVTFLAIMLVTLCGKAKSTLQAWLGVLLTLASIQVLLGIVTLLTVVSLDVALLHQAVGALLFGWVWVMVYQYRLRDVTHHSS